MFFHIADYRSLQRPARLCHRPSTNTVVKPFAISEISEVSEDRAGSMHPADLDPTALCKVDSLIFKGYADVQGQQVKEKSV